MKELTLYCNCFPNHLNRETQFNQKNLMCGAFALSQEERSNLPDFYFDDTGDNISSLNVWLGDLTGLYWVWKNTNDEFVGTNQYRRFFSNESLSLNDNTLYVSNPVHLGQDVLSQYVQAHGPNGINILSEAIRLKKIDMTIDMLTNMSRVGCLSACNMFFGHRKLFDKTCEILFDIIFEMYEGSKYTLPYIQPDNQTRLLAFMAERILNIIYLNKNYYYGNIDIVPVQMHLVE